MGFLDNLISKETRKFISNVVDSVVDNVKDAIKEAGEAAKDGAEENHVSSVSKGSGAGTAPSAAKTAAPSTAKAAAPSTARTGTKIPAAVEEVEDPDEEDCYRDRAVICARVEKVLTEEWIGYEMRKDVPPEEMEAPEGSWGYTYGLYLDGQPKAMIMVIGPSQYRRKSVRLAHQACKEKGVFCMNLLLHLPNRKSYISKQLKENVVV